MKLITSVVIIGERAAALGERRSFMERNIYLSNTDIEEAAALYLEKISGAINEVKTEQIDIRKARGRVTAAPVIARLSSPNHNAAAMDGIMVNFGQNLFSQRIESGCFKERNGL